MVIICSLTAELNDLQTAEKAVTDYLEAAPELDSTGLTPAGSVDVEAGKATAQNVKDYYDDVAASVGHSSNVNVTGFADKTVSVQDAYIAAHETSLSADIDSAKADLPSNMTTLLETMETRKETVVEKLIADDTQADNLNAEVAAFASANEDTDTSAIDPLSDAFVEYESGVTDAPVSTTV